MSASNRTFLLTIIIIITDMPLSSINFLFNITVNITDISASGMNFLFMGVSRVTGRRPRAQLLEGRPDPGLPRLGESCRIVLVSWC